MSGDARISGRITITPPITWAELRANEWAMHHYADAHIKVDHNDVDTDQGVLSARFGVAIVPCDGETNGHNLTADVQRVVDAFPTTPDGTPRAFSGWLHVIWGGGDEVYRVHVVDGRAHEARPSLAWPAGARDEDGTP